jgi:DNA-binding transcriptional LysR family regulator
MIIDNLNLNLLRVFECVYRTKSMTKAAGELHMTQSGVSQNIKNLEDILEVKLFDRVKQRPVPTHKAHDLFKRTSVCLYDIEKTLADIKDQDQSLKGNVIIGVPIEYGNNVILPLLAKWGSKQPGLTFKMVYGHASDMNNLILTGKLDFAFVDTFGLDKQIKSEKVFNETLNLCASKEYVKAHGPVSGSKKYFDELDYISYIDDAPVLKSWFKHHLKVQNFQGKIKASLMDVQGMAQMISSGFGVGILPSHVLTKFKEMGHQLHVYKGSGKPLHNEISVAYLESRTQSPAVEQTLEYLKSNL